MSNTTNNNNNFQLNNPSTRHITIIRNESGYGFTLSRYIIHSNDQQQIVRLFYFIYFFYLKFLLILKS